MLIPILVGSGVLTVLVGAVAVLAWRQQPHPGARSFAAAAGGVAWWLGAMTAAHVCDQYLGLHVAFVFLTRIEWAGIFATTIGWFVFALEYTGRSEYATRRIVGLLGTVPLLTYPVAFTNGLFVDAVAPLVGVSTTLGPSFDPWLAVEPLVLAYIYVLLAASSLVLLAFVLTSRLPHPEVAILWLLALAIPWGINALYVSGTIPPLGPALIDPTPFGFVGLVVIGLVAIDRYDAFRVAPVARAYVVDQLDEGIVVCDGDCRILDANDWAQSVLDVDPRSMGRDVRDLLLGAIDGLRADGMPRSSPDRFVRWMDGRTVRVDRDGETIAVSIQASTLQRAYGEAIDPVDGYALVLRDETSRIERKRVLEEQNEQLEIINQVVRHDIRNDMQIVRGVSEELDDHVDEPGEQYLETVVDSVDSVVELTRTVRGLTETILNDEADLEPIPLRPTLKTEVNEVAASFDEADVSLGDVPDATVRANDMLGSVFRNLLQNAILHNDAATPRVRVSVEETPDSVVVSVIDNGPGISTDRRDRVFDRGERGRSSSGSGLGLYLVQSLVGHYGGQVSIESAGSTGESGDTARTNAAVETDENRIPDSEGTIFVVELEKSRRAD